MHSTPATQRNAPPEIRDWHAIAILAILVALFFRDILLQRAWLWEDFLTQAYPFRNFAAVSLASGEIPLWNPYTFGGMPFQADIQTGIFYLPNLLLTAFVRDGRLSFHAFEVSLVFHYWIAGVTMYYLAKDFELDAPFALFSGLLFSLSGFLVVHAIHPAFIQQLAWFPLALLLFRRALNRNCAAHAILTGLVIGLSLLAGAPQMTLFLLLLLSAYALFVAITRARERDLRSAGSVLWLTTLAFVVLFGVAAIQLLPTLELRPLSERATMSFSDAQHGRLAWQQLITAVVPRYFGYTGAQARVYWGPGDYGAFWESCFYIGIAGLFAAVTAVSRLKSNRDAAFLFAVVIFAVLIALGDQFVLHRLLFQFAPGFGAFRGIGRIMVLAVFAGALLAGFGLRTIVQESRPVVMRPNLLLMAAIAVAIILCVLLRTQLLPGFVPPAGGTQPDVLAAAMRETTIAVVIVSVVAALLLSAWRGLISWRFAFPLLIAAQFVDMNLFGFAQNNAKRGPSAYFDEITPDVIRILKDEGKREIFRVASRRDSIMFLDRNHGMVERIFLLEGYTPLKLKRTLPPLTDLETTYDLMNVKYRPREIDLKGTLALRSSPNYFPRAFIVHDVVVAANELDGEAIMQRAQFNPRRSVVLDRDPRLSLTSPTDSARAVITSYRNNVIALEVQNQADGVLVLSEIFYPGWRARVDGVERPVLRANAVLRAIPLPARSQRVELVFAPGTYYLGLWITCATLLASVGYLAVVRSHKELRKSTR